MLQERHPGISSQLLLGDVLLLGIGDLGIGLSGRVVLEHETMGPVIEHGLLFPRDDGEVGILLVLGQIGGSGPQRHARSLWRSPQSIGRRD